MTAMLRICAWCKREIGADGAAVGGPILELLDAFRITDFAITHGICRACEEEQLAELNQWGGSGTGAGLGRPGPR